MSKSLLNSLAKKIKQSMSPSSSEDQVNTEGINGLAKIDQETESSPEFRIHRAWTNMVSVFGEEDAEAIDPVLRNLFDMIQSEEDKELIKIGFESWLADQD